MTILFIVSAFVVQLIYWYYFFKKLSDHKSTTNNLPKGSSDPISVVICAKNAGPQLCDNLPIVLNQEYPDYEVLIADDHSTDNTREVLKEIDNEKRILSVYKVKQNNAGKRQALWEGIVKTRHLWVLLTDADCKPLSSQWIAAMLKSRQTPKHKLILGYSPYRPQKTLVSWWSHFEAWITGLLYLSFAVRGRPYMGVGRNMSYAKSLLSKDYLDRYEHLASGDDDLTVMQMATSENTTICLDPHSFVETESEPSWWAYFKQKRRHFSTASSYKRSTIILLSGYSMSQIAFYALVFWCICTDQTLIALGIYLARFLLIWPIMLRLCTRLQARFHPLLFPLFDFGLAVYYVLFSFSVLFPKKNAW